MSRKQKIIIAAIAIIALILIGVSIFLWNRRTTADILPENNSPKTGTQIIIESEKLPVKQIAEDTASPTPVKADPKILKEMGIKTFAQSFIERWGSYSNHSDYDNFTSLNSLMTERMQKWADGYVSKEKSRIKSYSFYGLTTKAVSAEILKSEDENAAVKLMCQKQENIDNDNVKISYGSFEMELVKENGNWKVASLYSK